MKDLGKHAVGLVIVGVLGGGCGDAFTSRVDAVARVGEYELGIEPLAELIATGKGLPLRRDVVEGVSALWVDYVVFADRLVGGDSLLDSATVEAAMWAETQQEIANRYHELLIGGKARLDSAAVDSAYEAGRHRLIRHVQFGVPPDASPEVRNAKRAVAEDTYRRLRSGGLTWAQAAEVSEDAATMARQGSLGIIAHGEMIPAIENAAFALAPGAISEVVTSTAGLHVLFRPALADVREEFAHELQLRREDTLDEQYLADLPVRWRIRVRDGIAPAVREVGNDPMRAKRSRTVLGTYRDGTFRVQDFARWLQAMPMEIRQQLPSASDSQITDMVHTLIRNEALLLEARDSGVTVTDEFVDETRDRLRRLMALMSALLGFPFDSLDAVRALPVEERRSLVGTRVFEYLRAVANNRKRLQTVPPFLADELRSRAEWALVPAGVERALDRARAMRLALEPTQPPPPTGPPAVLPPEVDPSTPADSGAQ